MADIGVVGRIDTFERIVQPQPIALRNVSGRFVFTPNRIRFSNVTGKIVNNSVTLSGSVEGYSPDAAITVYIVANDIQIPTAPRYSRFAAARGADALFRIQAGRARRFGAGIRAGLRKPAT